MSPRPETASLSEANVGIVESFREGRERGLARAISRVEDEAPGFEELLDVLHEDVGRARRIGITGPPGAGKSTLTARLARRYRDAGLTVGIVAVDPTSPFTGGALLGDRVRMTELATEPGIFIRSMASRGSLGGLATSTREVADLMDAFGFDRVIVETVGVGQSELQIADSADTTVVILVPESGDGIQAMKAGLMEVADIFVVNKSDRPGADRLKNEIRVIGGIRRENAPPGATSVEGTGSAADAADRESPGDRDRESSWEPPVRMCVATTGKGLEALATTIDDHFSHLERSGRLETRRRERLLEQARSVLLRRAERRTAEIWSARAPEHEEELFARRISPYRMAAAISAGLDEFGR